MVIALGSRDGRPVLLLGLEEENLDRLRKGQPILRDLTTIGRPDLGEVMIVWGKTAADIEAQLRPGIGPETLRVEEGRPS